MAAFLVGNSLRLDNDMIVDLGTAKVVRPHQTNPNYVYIDDQMYDLGTAYAGLRAAISTALGS